MKDPVFDHNVVVLDVVEEPTRLAVESLFFPKRTEYAHWDMPLDRWQQSSATLAANPIIIGLCARFRRFYFMRCNAHYQRFTGSNLMVADTAAVLFLSSRRNPSATG